MRSCWQDWRASGDPLDVQKSSPAPSPALPLAAHSKMPLSQMVTPCCPRAPEDIPQWSGLHIHQITLQLLVRNDNFSYQLNSLSLQISFDGLWFLQSLELNSCQCYSLTLLPFVFGSLCMLFYQCSFSAQLSFTIQIHYFLNKCFLNAVQSNMY